MYYEEYESESSWWYRTTPNGNWEPFTAAMYTEKIRRLSKKLEDSEDFE